MRGTTAILIVNGGQDPARGRWLQLCLEKVITHTHGSVYHVYVWNNNTADTWVSDYVPSIPQTTLIQADPSETLTHPHAVPLQRLYERAVSDGAAYIVALDSDAHPLRDNWLNNLTGALDAKTVLAGVWRDELAAGIEPYLHASCLCTTVDFIRQHNLRFDVIPENSGKRSDTLSTFTDKANELGLGIHKLRRSNRNNIHHLIGGIYGDTIYHHGAGSRPQIFFWGGDRSEYAAQLNRQFRDTAAALLFEHYAPYMAWLQATPRTTLILGMHRSGTSCLAGCLERCGLHLGDVSRSNQHNPRGNHELQTLVQFHESVLASRGGSWALPPTEGNLLSYQQREALNIVAPVLATPPAGLKEPRMLLFLDDWREMIPNSQLIGTYRHPGAVVQSLVKRNSMSERDALAVWLHYNTELVRHHRSNPFPIISFDIPNAAEYVRAVAAAAVSLGLKPNLGALREFVSDEYRHETSQQQDVPEPSREIYQYLTEHQYRPGDFERGIVHLCELLEKATTTAPRTMKNVVVLGSGRSGTSMVTGTLARAGYFMGDNLWPERHSNPQGFYEDRDINYLNERLIRSAINRRYRWVPRWFRPAQPSDWQRWLAAIPFGTHFKPAPWQTESMRKLTVRAPFCFKDPRFCYTLPAWRPYLKDTVFLCVFRDPSATAASILKECSEEAYLQSLPMTRQKALRVWNLMYRHVLDLHRHEGTWLFLHYQQVLSGDAFRRMESVIGVAVDAEFPKPELNRTSPLGSVPDDVQQTYRELCALAGYTP